MLEINFLWNRKNFFIGTQAFANPTDPASSRCMGYLHIYLSTHVSGTARTAVSFSGVILNNSESSRMHFSSSVLTLLIANLEEASLFLSFILCLLW